MLEHLSRRIPRPEIIIELLVPFERGDVVAALHAAGAVLDSSHVAEGTLVRARVREDHLGRLDAYVISADRADRLRGTGR